MAKSLRSMSESERKAAIARRLSSKTMGLGYWGAFDAQARLTKRALDGACESCKLELTPSCPIRTGNGCDLYQPRQ